jgi:hypothetical protein
VQLEQRRERCLGAVEPVGAGAVDLELRLAALRLVERERPFVMRLEDLLGEVEKHIDAAAPLGADALDMRDLARGEAVGALGRHAGAGGVVVGVEASAVRANRRLDDHPAASPVLVQRRLEVHRARRRRQRGQAHREHAAPPDLLSSHGAKRNGAAGAPPSPHDRPGVLRARP